MHLLTKIRLHIEAITDALDTYPSEVPLRFEHSPHPDRPSKSNTPPRSANNREIHSSTATASSVESTDPNAVVDADSVIMAVDLVSRNTASLTAKSDEVPRICVRCFNSWQGRIEDGKFDLPDCEFANGRKRKKCKYCSDRRSECVMLPLKIRLPLIQFKEAMCEAALGGDVAKAQATQERFSRIYHATHGIVRAELVSDERRRRRDRATALRQRRKEGRTGQTKGGENGSDQRQEE